MSPCHSRASAAFSSFYILQFDNEVRHLDSKSTYEQNWNQLFAYFVTPRAGYPKLHLDLDLDLNDPVDSIAISWATFHKRLGRGALARPPPPPHPSGEGRRTTPTPLLPFPSNPGGGSRLRGQRWGEPFPGSELVDNPCPSKGPPSP